MSRLRLVPGGVAVVVLLVVGFLVTSTDPGPAQAREDGGTTAASQPPELSGEITVLAAASLVDAFTVLADTFQRDHPDVLVTLGFGPSSALAAQVAAGAPADVLATADQRTMDLAVDALVTSGKAGSAEISPDVFARNTLALAVPATDPGDVDELSDLARDGVTFAMCAEQVPCGAAALRVLEAAGIEREPVTYEADVGAVLTKVLLAEVDAGFVYSSDVRPSAQAVLDGEVLVVRVPDEVQVTTTYPIAVLPGPQHDLAAAFVAHVRSTAGRQALADAGFLAP